LTHWSGRRLAGASDAALRLPSPNGNGVPERVCDRGRGKPRRRHDPFSSRPV